MWNSNRKFHDRSDTQYLTVCIISSTYLTDFQQNFPLVNILDTIESVLRIDYYFTECLILFDFLR